MKKNLVSFIPLYVETARVYVQRLQDNIAALEKDPRNTYYSNSTYMFAHSMTGQSAVMGFSQTEAVCKLIEKLFYHMQAERSVVDMAILHKLEDALHALKENIDSIEKDNRENDLSGTIRILMDI